MSKKTRRRFSDEFKADTVSLMIDQGYSVSEPARHLDVVERSVLDRWCHKHRHQVSSTPGGGQEDDRDAEIRKFREKVSKLLIEKIF